MPLLLTITATGSALNQVRRHRGLSLPPQPPRMRALWIVSAEVRGQMQFSLKVLLVVVGLVALAMATPFGIVSGFLAFFWYSLPGVLIVLVLRRNEQQRVFGWGASVSYVALTLGPHVPSVLQNSLLGFVAVGLSGLAATAVDRRLASESNRKSSETGGIE